MALDWENVLAQEMPDSVWIRSRIDPIPASSLNKWHMHIAPQGEWDGRWHRDRSDWRDTARETEPLDDLL